MWDKTARSVSSRLDGQRDEVKRSMFFQGHSGTSFAINLLAGLSMLCIAALAAARPAPPTLLCDDGPCGGPVEGAPPLFQTGWIEPGGDLGPLPAFVTPNWPVAPSLRAHAHDTNGDGIPDASLWVGGSGQPTEWNHGWETDIMSTRRMVVEPGTYNGNIMVNCTDCEIYAVGVTFNGNLEFGQGGRRVVWTGGTVRGHVSNNGTSDLLINNLHAANPSPSDQSFGQWTGGGSGWERVAIINSTLEATGLAPSPGNAGWIFYTQPFSPPRQRDLIMANVRLENRDGQVIRMQGVENVIMYRFVINGNNTATSGFRMHHENANISMRDGLIVGLANSQADTPAIRNGRIENVQRLYESNNHWMHPFNIADNVTINNSHCYSPSRTGGECPLGEAVAGPDGNVYVEWNGALPVAPTTDGSDFRVGADH